MLPLIIGAASLIGAAAGWIAKDVTAPETVNNYQGSVSQDQRAGMSPLMVGAVVVGALAAGFFIAKQAAK
jgi:hypothetical protein